MTESSSLSTPFDDLAVEYDRWFEEKGHLIFDIEVQAFKRLLSSLPKPWLEIGVGSGRFARALGIETGVDPSSELLRLARKRGVRAVQGRVEQGLFQENSWGSVFFIVTLCFLDSPPEALREAHRILDAGGKIVLGLVLKESPWGRFYIKKKGEGHRFYRHAEFYSYDETSRLLSDAGFTIETVFSTLFQKPGEVHRLESPRKGYFSEAGFTIIAAGKREDRRPADS